MNSPTYTTMTNSSTSSEKSTGSAKSDNPTTLCDLPCEVLHKILCLLPIQEAVRTCVISRRWEHLWRSMPCLSFVQSLHTESRDHFINFVDKVCSLHDPRYPIQSFELWCDLHDHDAHRISSIIRAAITDGHQMEVICLVLSNRCEVEPFALPSSIFSSETLVRLQLSIYRSKKGSLELPDSISLPRLKYLKLGGLEFTNLTSLQKLFSCPLLEELGIWMCFSGYTESTITICNPNLKKLSLTDDLPPLRVDCENLKELSCSGNLIYEFHVIGKSIDLDQVTLGFGEWSVPIHGFKLLKSISGTKRLTLCLHSFKVLDPLDQLYGRLRFGNLVELSLFGFEALGGIAETMLRNSSSLQILTIQGVWERPPLESSVLLNPVPNCLKTHLKKVYVFVNGVGDVDFVATLLKIGQVLEEVGLQIPCPKFGGDTVVEMTRNLPKASENCRLSWYRLSDFM